MDDGKCNMEDVICLMSFDRLRIINHLQIMFF